MTEKISVVKRFVFFSPPSSQLHLKSRPCDAVDVNRASTEGGGQPSAWEVTVAELRRVCVKSVPLPVLLPV